MEITIKKSRNGVSEKGPTWMLTPHEITAWWIETVLWGRRMGGRQQDGIVESKDADD